MVADHQAMERRMFVDCHTYIPIPFSEAKARFAGTPNRWLAEVGDALPDDSALEGEMAVGKSALLSKRCVLRTGRPVETPASVYLPLRMEATGPKGLFPELDADLTIEPAGSSGTKLTLRGSYRPPLEGFGKLLDRVALHRIAETSLQDLLERLSIKLTDGAFAGQPQPLRMVN